MIRFSIAIIRRMPWLLFIFVASLPLNSCAPSVATPEHPVSAGSEKRLATYKRGDYATVLKEFRPLAEQGHAEAQYNLGIMSADGQGVSQDYVRAHMWWSLAGAAGNKGAVKNRDIVEKRMTPAQIEEAQRLAREWKPKKSQ